MSLRDCNISYINAKSFFVLQIISSDMLSKYISQHRPYFASLLRPCKVKNILIVCLHDFLNILFAQKCYAIRKNVPSQFHLSLGVNSEAKTC